MTITNREVFGFDPTEVDIPNLGVAKVEAPESPSEWATLEWELRSFVCEGEYERGLERILDQFLSHLNQAQQPAVWVSGFFGSGKSHMVRVLEYLWRDYELPSGASARGLADLPDSIKAELVELSSAAKRVGGLWSAAGTLGAGVSGSMRLAFLTVIFDAAGLPQQYGPAKLAIRLKNENKFDQVRASVEGEGRDFAYEFRNLYVSSALAQALIEAGATYGDSPAAVSATLQAQFPMAEDISEKDMLDTFEEVLKLETSTEGKLPLVLVVLDEMQQYINDDNAKALEVQGLAEACSSKFGSQVLIVATGQAALTANPTLQKLIDRFSVTVALSDADVETVVRKVVLRKKPEAIPWITDALDKVSGEIDRELGGTRLEARAADKAILVADYPLLPTRRRFWERALRAIDNAGGKAGALRTQLKIVHEAARSVANETLGTVIGGDFVFRSESASMMQSGVLLKEIDELIRGLQDGTADGELKSRACALVFLISQLPHDGVGDTGVRATAANIADLLVEDLAADGALLRKDVPRVLEELVEQGRVMKLGDEYRLQTEEGAEWTKEFNQRRASIRDDATRMSQLRNEWLLKSVDDELSGIKLLQGESKTPRKLDRVWGDVELTVDGSAIPVWIRDEWNITEAKAKEAAAQAGVDSPVVFVLLPKVDAEGIRDALANYAAALDTVNQRPEPQTDQGRQAKQGMQSRASEGQARLHSLFGTVISKARVFQGGGNEPTTSSLRDGVESAGRSALTRLFPKFGPGDNVNWNKVIDKARDGAPDALATVGWTGEVPDNPVCKEVLARTSGAGTKGSELQGQLMAAPYGWPKDAVDAALLALLSNGNTRAEREGVPVAGAKELPPTQIGKSTFYKEDAPPTTPERLAVRGLLGDAGVHYVSGQEGAAISGLLQHLMGLAHRAGGSTPLPPPPDIDHLSSLMGLAGNQQFREVAKAAEQLRQDISVWTAEVEQCADREAEWARLNRLLNHAQKLDGSVAVIAQRDAIMANRLLLSEPDPVAPLVASLVSMLREAVTSEVAVLRSAYKAELAGLEASAEWKQLGADDRAELLKDAVLAPIDDPVVNTDEELLKVLDSTPLAVWKERAQALPAKVSAARVAASRKLEPKSVTLKPACATIKTEAEVDVYISALRDELIQHVTAGETIII
jgi:hypothetical protein